MPEPTNQLSVELDAFSGRPNPRWELSPAEGDALLAALRALAPEPARARAPDGLGYRGVVVHLGGEEIRLYRRTVFREQGTFRDPGRALEQRILASAPQELLALVRGIVATEGLGGTG